MVGVFGVNDDVSGIVMVFELVCVFKIFFIDIELWFVIFGVEEVGLLGFEYYVSELFEDEKNCIVGMFNLDMVGSWDVGDLVMNIVDGILNFVIELV